MWEKQKRKPPFKSTPWTCWFSWLCPREPVSTVSWWKNIKLIFKMTTKDRGINWFQLYFIKKRNVKFYNFIKHIIIFRASKMLGSSKHENLLPRKGHSPVILSEISNKARFLRNKSIFLTFHTYRNFLKSLWNKNLVLNLGLK